MFPSRQRYRATRSVDDGLRYYPLPYYTQGVAEGDFAYNLQMNSYDSHHSYVSSLSRSTTGHSKASSNTGSETCRSTSSDEEPRTLTSDIRQLFIMQIETWISQLTAPVTTSIIMDITKMAHRNAAIIRWDLQCGQRLFTDDECFHIAMQIVKAKKIIVLDMPY